MKKELKTKTLGFAAAGILALAIGGGYGVGHYNAVNDDQTTAVEHMAKLQKDVLQRQIMMAQKASAASAVHAAKLDTANVKSENKIISEVFKITSIDSNGFVRGELVTGRGEGIYYDKRVFDGFGLDDIKTGDIVRFGWTEYNYDNAEWDDIAELERLEEN